MYGNSLFRRVVSSNVRYYKANSTKKLLEFLADMPKANSARILESQRQRQHIAKKAQKYGPSTVYLQVLGSGARGAPNTLYLFTDQKRYLFNCGECTQRLAHEHKVKLSRLDHIFITSKTWRNIGGLPGLSLTLQDVGVPHITLHGPEGLDEIYTATKRFVIMNNMNVTMAKCSPNEDFEDNVMSVKYVILSKETDELLMEDLKPPTKKQRVSEPIEKDLEVFMHDNTDYYKSDVRASHAHSSEQRKHSTKPDSKEKKSPSYSPPRSPKRVEKPLLDKKREDCTVSYICTLKKRLGTLDLAKCVEMGVKPGPMLGMLKNGQDVVLSDGTLVLSKDVKTPDDPGPVFIVLDVPHISYLKPTEFRQNFANAINPPENIPTLIVHFTPPEVFHDTRYQEFLALFGPTPRHLIINGQNSCLGSESVHKTQHKLHLLDNDIFPILKDVSVPAVWNAHPPVPKSNSPLRLKGMEELKNKIAFAQFQNIIHMDGDSQQKPSEDDTAQLQLIAGRTLTMFHLRPKKQLDRSAEPKLHIQQYLQETMDVDGFVGSLEQFRRLVDSMRYKSGKQQEYPKVVFLGTGSCIPSKTRNTSAIAVQIDESRSMLLDCGEGTFCQLVRFYGPKRVNAFLRTLKAIYISHLHADHHIGLIGVLQARRQAFEELNLETPPEPCYLLAPGQIMCWLTMYDQRFERIRADFTLIPNQNLLLDRQKPSSDLTAATLAHIGLDMVATCLVPHCPNAFGVVVEIGEHKITYSGDTLPCETLVSLGYNSTLLIHEATMEDELADEARMKMHSTTTQAIEIGKAMNARYTVLTHFSQRYARLPRLNANILNDNKSIGIAFDNMQITMSDLQLLPHMYAPLQLMFAEHCLELELKAANRARQKGSTGASSQSGYTSPGSPFQYRSPGVSSPHTDRSTISDSSTSREMRAIEKKLRRALSPLALARSVSDTKCKINNNISVAESKCSELSAASLNLSADSEHFSEGLVNLKAPRTASYVSEMSKESKSGVSDIQKSPTKNRMILAEDKHYERQKQAEKMYEKSSISVFDNITKCYAKSLVSPVAHTPRELSMRRRDIVSPTDRTKSIPKTPAYVIKDTVKPYKISGEKCVKNYVSKIPTKRPTDSASKLRATNTTVPISRDLSRDSRRSPTKEVTRASSITNKYIPSALHSTRQSSFTVYNASPEKSRSSSLHRTKIETSLKSSGLRQPQIQITRNYLQKLDNMGREYNMGRVGREYNLNREYNIGREYNMGQEHKPTTIGNYLDSKTKQKISTFGRPGFRVYSNRSFKPQLEDIKSSYLLLNNKKSRETNASKLLDVLKPRPLNEEERRQKLQQAKQQFQSKQFWHDSKYEKIEGLNWISWK